MFYTVEYASPSRKFQLFFAQNDRGIDGGGAARGEPAAGGGGE
jgi:hypothetical protein